MTGKRKPTGPHWRQSGATRSGNSGRWTERWEGELPTYLCARGLSACTLETSCSWWSRRNTLNIQTCCSGPTVLRTIGAISYIYGLTQNTSSAQEQLLLAEPVCLQSCCDLPSNINQIPFHSDSQNYVMSAYEGTVYQWYWLNKTSFTVSSCPVGINKHHSTTVSH